MTLRIALAQVNPVVGDLDGNAVMLAATWAQAADAGADLVIFPELVLSGYPPEDLLLKPAFVAAGTAALAALARDAPPGTAAIVGHVGVDAGGTTPGRPASTGRRLTNAASVLFGGEVRSTYVKRRLPNYGVFDEARYFVPGRGCTLVGVSGAVVGLTVCEDLWTAEGPVAEAATAGAGVVANLNASPYHRGKGTERLRWATHHARAHGIHVVYVNQVGGQDELVFDGDSFVVDPAGDVVARAAQFATDLVVVDLEVATPAPPEPSPGTGAVAAVIPSGRREAREPLPASAPAPRLGPVEEVFEALTLGTRDYCTKNGFGRAVIGLSGGVDSAVTAAVAVRALGAEAVLGVAMPSRHSSPHSLEDARELAVDLAGMPFEVVPIEPAVTAFESSLGALLDRLADAPAHDVTWQNVQARVRGIVLMAISNRTGRILLTTGNKSEMALGYTTLYGDMAGGFAVLKDCPKTLVYELARLARDRWGLVPPRSITKPPSAELAPGQLDTDTLPPYDVLDPVLEALVEHDLAVEDVVARGLADDATARRIAAMIDGAEYKRRQGPPGIKITRRAFGKDRRVPITSRWRA